MNSAGMFHAMFFWLGWAVLWDVACAGRRGQRRAAVHGVRADEELIVRGQAAAH